MGAQRKALHAELPLAERLKARIARDGLISVEAYMQACLADADGGYYATRQPIGKDGDFVTAPEVSQIFGELVGLWAAAVWQSMGTPRPTVIAELGPGRGTLMADALRAWRNVPGLLDAASVALVETSPALGAIQKARLADAPVPLIWHEHLEDVPQGPLIVIANEFLDALPIRQIVRRDGAWRERCVGLDARDGFAFVEGETVAIEEPGAAEGDILEFRPAADKLLATLGVRAAKGNPVAALFIDYGHEASGFGDTLQAVSHHDYADPFARPGEADLTAHVDFATLKRAAEAAGLSANGPIPQGTFLLSLGLEARRDRLLKRATETQAEAILTGAARLADPRQMGLLFKVLAVTSAGLAPPPPFGEI
ncbi:MAG: class I SAM-dependent methyltransferase [Methyloceanibacter sp.]